MSLSGSSRLQVEQLGHDQVGDLVVHGCPQEDDALVEQAGVDVEGALAARRLLDHHGDKWAHGPRLVLVRRLESCRAEPSNRSLSAWPVHRVSAPGALSGPSGPLRRARTPGVQSSAGCSSGSPASRASRSSRAPRPARAGSAWPRLDDEVDRLALARSSSRSVVQAAGLLEPVEQLLRRRALALRRSPAARRGCSLVGRLDALGLDDRGEHGLAPQRLLGVGLAPPSRSSVLGLAGDLQVGVLVDALVRRASAACASHSSRARASTSASGTSTVALGDGGVERRPRGTRPRRARSSRLAQLRARCPRAARRACRSRRPRRRTSSSSSGSCLRLDLLDGDRELGVLARRGARRRSRRGTSPRPCAPRRRSRP